MALGRCRHERVDVRLCEPGLVRSPDGERLAALLRENRRVKNSHAVFSDDEGADPPYLPAYQKARRQ